MGEKIANVDKFKEVLAKMMENRNNLGDIIANFECEGYKINPDERYTKGILDGIDKKGGYCPCQVGIIPEIICPCEHLRYTGHCCCKMFVKE